MRPRLLLAVLACVVASCAEVGEPYVGTPPTTEATAGLVTTAPEALAAPADPTAEESTTPTTDLFAAPAAPEDFVPVLLVGGDPVRVGSINAWQNLADVLGTEIRGDLFGGLLTADETATIRWYRPGQAEPDVVPLPAGRLVGVTAVDAAPAAILATPEGTLVASRLLRADGELGGETVTLVELTEGDTLLDYSTRSGLQALALGDEECGEIRLQLLTGEVLDAGPVAGDCPVPRRPFALHVALHPEATQLVYTAVTYRDDNVVARTELVLHELESGAETVRLPLAEVGETVLGIDFDGTRVVALVDREGETEVVVLDLGTGEEPRTRLADGATSVQWSRLPITVDLADE